MTCNFLKQRTNKNWRFCVFVENVGTNRKLWLTKKNENFGGKKMFRSEFRKKCFDLISSKVMVKVKSSPYLFVFSVGLRLKQEVVSWRPKKLGRVAPSRFSARFNDDPSQLAGQLLIGRGQESASPWAKWLRDRAEQTAASFFSILGEPTRRDWDWHWDSSV